MNEIYGALITGVFSLAVGFIGLWAGKKDAKSLSQNQILEAQLSNVWEPMEKLFNFSQTNVPLDTLKSLVDIVSANYKLVPQEIINEIYTLRKKARLDDRDFLKLKAIASSYYNWTRKTLGYPYNRQQIKMEYTPNSRVKIILVVTINFVLLFLLICSSFVFLAAILSFSVGTASAVPEWMLICCTYFLVLGITWIFFNQAHRK